MIEICFTVLHYKTYIETIQCVDSILKLSCPESIKVIIVDNGSKDNSTAILKKYYLDNPAVDIYENNENTGFSDGMNLGYQMAKKFNPVYIVVCNNDLIFPDQRLKDNLDYAYINYKFSVLGPNILVKDTMISQNPMRLLPPTIDEIQKDIKKWKSIVNHINFYVNIEYLKTLKSKVYRKYYNVFYYYTKLKHTFKGRNKALTNSYAINPVLHGSCFILSPIFIKANEEIYNVKTHFYREEELLWLRCQSQNMLLLYSPLITVYHAHGATTTKLHKQLKDYLMFRANELLASDYILIEQLKKYYSAMEESK